jgi:hypothetical protein
MAEGHQAKDAAGIEMVVAAQALDEVHVRIGRYCHRREMRERARR